MAQEVKTAETESLRFQQNVRALEAARAAEGLCIRCGRSPAPAPLEGHPYCEDCIASNRRRSQRYLARKRLAANPFGIIIYSPTRTYLAASFEAPGAKAGRSLDPPTRIGQVAKACGVPLFQVAEHRERDFEAAIFEFFGRRDPWYDGDGKTEWPDASLPELIQFFLAHGGQECYAAEALMEAQSKMIWLPGDGLEVARFEIVTKEVIAP